MTVHTTPRPPRWFHWTLVGIIVAAVAWGALAFGAVYAWAYTPLMIACAAVGTAAWFTGRRGRPPLAAVARGLAAIGVAAALQLVPLPLPALAAVSPGTDEFLRQYDFSYQLARSGAVDAEPPAPGAAPVRLRTRQATSIAPRKTALALALFAALFVFLMGTARLLSIVGVRRLAGLLVAFGTLLALVGIVQAALIPGQMQFDYQPLIYGFWRPLNPASPFGPFVNPNHFAGWMIMVMPVALAASLDRFLQLGRAAGAGRERLSALNTPDFSALLAFAGAFLVMGVSLFMTRSRSGVAVFMATSLLVGWMVLRRQASAKARAVAGLVVLGLVIGTVAFAGVDAIVTKFTESEGQKSYVARVVAWRDAAAIARRFPLTGSGLDTFGEAELLYQSNRRVPHFQEAHNDYLQIAAEGGLLVGLPVLIALVLFVREVRRRFREAPHDGGTYWLRVGAVVGLVAVALQSLVEFSLQMPGNAVLFTVLAAVALHQSPRLQPVRRQD